MPIFALLLLTGLTKRPSYDLYWSTDPLIEMPGFRAMMPWDKLLRILTFWHHANNEEVVARDQPGYDKAFNVHPLLNRLVLLWQNYLLPAKELSVDESMIPFKGNTNLKQYMPAKPSKSVQLTDTRVA